MSATIIFLIITLVQSYIIYLVGKSRNQWKQNAESKIAEITTLTKAIESYERFYAQLGAIKEDTKKDDSTKNISDISHDLNGIMQ